MVFVRHTAKHSTGRGTGNSTGPAAEPAVRYMNGPMAGSAAGSATGSTGQHIVQHPGSQSGRRSGRQSDHRSGGRAGGRALALACIAVLCFSLPPFAVGEANAASRSPTRLTMQERLDRILPVPVDNFEPYLPEGWEPFDSGECDDCLFEAITVRNGNEYLLKVKRYPEKNSRLEELAAFGEEEDLERYENKFSEFSGIPTTLQRMALVGRSGLVHDTYHTDWSRSEIFIFCNDTQYGFSFWFESETDWSDIWRDMLRIAYISRLPEETPGIGVVLPMGWVTTPNISEPNERVMDVLNAHLVAGRDIVVCMVSLQSAQYAFNEVTLRRMPPESIERECARMMGRFSPEWYSRVQCGREEYFGHAAIMHEFAAKEEEDGIDAREYNFYPDSGPFTISFYGDSLEKHEKDIMKIVKNTVSLMTR